MNTQNKTLMILSIITEFKTPRHCSQAKRVKNTPFRPLHSIWVLAVYHLSTVLSRNLRVQRHLHIERVFHDFLELQRPMDKYVKLIVKSKKGTY